VQVTRSENQVWLAGHNWDVVGRLLDGDYVDVRKHMGVEPTTTVTVDRAELYRICNLARCWAKDGDVRFEVLPDGLKIGYYRPETCGFSRRLQATVNGDPLEFGARTSLMGPILREMAGREVTLGLRGARQPFLITSQDQPHLRFLQLPLITF
jgi:DNA polymerase III sliding clamp (beta) subunit (PCNA family)